MQMSQSFVNELKKLLNFVQWSIQEYRKLGINSIDGSECSSLCHSNQKILESHLEVLQSNLTLSADLDQHYTKASEAFELFIAEVRKYCISFSELTNKEIDTVENLAKDFAVEHNIDLDLFVWTEDETCVNDTNLLRFSNKQVLSTEAFNYNGLCSKSTCGEFFHFSSIFEYFAQVLARCKQLAKVFIIFQLACEQHWGMVVEIVKVLLSNSRSEAAYNKIEKKMIELVKFQEKMKRSYSKVNRFEIALAKQLNLIPKHTCLQIKTGEIKSFFGEKLKNTLNLMKYWLEKLEILIQPQIDSRLNKRKVSINDYQPSSASFISTPLFYKYFNIRQIADKVLQKETFIENTEKILKFFSNHPEKKENLNLILSYVQQKHETGSSLTKLLENKINKKRNEKKNFSLKYTYTLKSLKPDKKSKFHGYTNILNKVQSSGRILVSEKHKFRSASTNRVQEDRIPNKLITRNKDLSSRFGPKFHRSSLIQTINNKRVLTMCLH